MASSSNAYNTPSRCSSNSQLSNVANSFSTATANKVNVIDSVKPIQPGATISLTDSKLIMPQSTVLNNPTSIVMVSSSAGGLNQPLLRVSSNSTAAATISDGAPTQTISMSNQGLTDFLNSLSPSLTSSSSTVKLAGFDDLSSISISKNSNAQLLQLLRSIVPSAVSSSSSVIGSNTTTTTVATSSGTICNGNAANTTVATLPTLNLPAELLQQTPLANSSRLLSNPSNINIPNGLIIPPPSNLVDFTAAAGFPQDINSLAMGSSSSTSAGVPNLISFLLQTLLMNNLVSVHVVSLRGVCYWFSHAIMISFGIVHRFFSMVGQNLDRFKMSQVIRVQINGNLRIGH